MDYRTLLIDTLRAKQYITPMEKDILDTWNEIQKYPFDMASAEWRVVSNDIKHPEIATMVNELPSTVPKPRDQITEDDFRYILTMQLSGLIAKESEEIQNVQ